MNRALLALSLAALLTSPASANQFFGGGGAAVPTATPQVFPTPAPSRFIWSGRTTTAVSSSATNYFAVVGRSAPSATEGDVNMPAASSGTTLTVTKLYCYLVDNLPGSGKTYTVSFRTSNTTDTALSVVLDNTGAAQSDSDVVTLAAAGAGFTYKVVPSGTPTAANIACSLEGSIS